MEKNENPDATSKLRLSEALVELSRGSRTVNGMVLASAHQSFLERFDEPPGVEIGSPADLGRKIQPIELERSTPATDKRPIATSSHLAISVGPGERTRLVIQGTNPGDWFHLLLSADFTQTAQPVIALRHFSGDSSERLVMRLRQTSLVLDQRVEIAPFSFDQPSLYSFRVKGGKITVAINGSLVLDRSCDVDEASGAVFDAIGSSDGVASVNIFAAWTSSSPNLPWLPPEDAAAYTGAQIVGASLGGTSVLARVLTALEAAEDNLTPSELTELIVKNRERDRAFPNHIEDMLLRRRSQKSGAAAIEGSAPPPLLDVKSVTIRLYANPAEKKLSSIWNGSKRIPTTIVDDLTFRCYSGDIVGIIGKNGAGKSSLLKSLVGAIPISSGRIDSVTKPILLRPGAGMVGELSGRQNIYKTGLYMDMTVREIDALIDDVIDFAELRDHIDRPFRYYSDGMRARLIFALATAVPRDILLLDELLSAGDASFQKKAVDRLESFMSRAKLVLVVQHTFDFVLSRCTKCLLLERGKPVYFGDPNIATELYRESL